MKKMMEWIEMFKFIKNINKHVTVQCTDSELFIQIMDSSHICLVDFKIASSWFHSYESSNEVFSMNSGVMVKIFSMFTKDSTLEIETNDDKIFIHLFNTQQNRHFEVPLMNIEQDILSSILTEPCVDFSIKSKWFDKYLQELSHFGEQLKLKIREDCIFLETSKEDGLYQIEIPNEQLEEFNIVENYTVELVYSLRYLVLLSSYSLVFPEVHLFFDEHSPLRITFKQEGFLIHFFLAPKFTDE